MKTYIFGFLTALTLFIGFNAHAITNNIAWYKTDDLLIGVSGGNYRVDKTYDENTDVVCYSFVNGYRGGISCLKNN